MDDMKLPGAGQPQGGRRVEKKGKKSLIAVVCVLAVLILAVGGAGAWVYLYGNIYPGVTAGGVDLSGLSRQEALAALETAFAAQSPGDRLDITVGEYTKSLDLSGVNAQYDPRQTTESAYLVGRTGTLFDRVGAIWRAMTAGSEITPAVSVDQNKLDAEIAQLSAEFSSEITQPAYTLENDKLILDRGQTGVYIDESEFLAFIRGRILSGDFTPAEYQPQVSSPDQLDLLMIKEEIEKPMQNPRLDLENDPTGGTILPAQRGVSLDLEKAQAALEATDERYVELPLTITEPTMTTEQFQSALFRDVLGEGTTSFNASLVGRTTNVKLACDFCNGVILNPGDEFSYNDTVGPRTYARGFKDAIVYSGATAEDGVGGGICQVSSTIYYAVLRADLEVVERKAHSRTVTYVPLGEDATVAWGYIDFRFKNDTDYPIRLDVTYGRSSMTVKLMGTKTEDKTVQMETRVLSKTPFETVRVENPELSAGASRVKSGGYTGYVTETYRVVYIDGVETSRTFENKSVYKKYDKVIEEGPVPVVNPDPGVIQPVDPDTTDPGTTTPTDPDTTDPGATAPTDPSTTDPGTATPTDPNATDPGTTTTTDPSITDPDTAAPGESGNESPPAEPEDPTNIPPAI